MAQNAVTDFAALTLELGGYEITGFSDATSYSAVYNNDQVTSLSGNKGLGAFAKKFDLGAVVTIELLATSEDNTNLSILHRVNLALPGGFLFPLQLLDGNGLTHQLSLNSAIMKFPDVTYSNGVETRTWAIACPQLRTIVGGAFVPRTGSLAEAQDLIGGLDPVPVAA